jgi:hypothetical protein
VVLNSRVRAGKIRRSVITNVDADRLDVSDSVLVNVTAPAVSGECILLYNAGSEEACACDAGSVRADAFLPGSGKHVMRTTLERDGKEDWYVKLPGNTLSYDELHKANTKDESA